MSNPKEHTDADGEGGGIYINLTIPPGVEPGVDSLTFQYEGNEMEIQVPEDSVPGDVLSIKVGCTDAKDSSSQNDRDGCRETMKKPSSLMDELGGIEDNDDCNDRKPTQNDGDGVASVTLGDGLNSTVTVRLLEKLPSPTNKQSEGDGTQSCLWPSGIVLAQALTSKMGIKYLISNVMKHNEEGCRNRIECMELGSGLGTCGIALAHALASIDTPRSIRSCHIVLTDRGDETIALIKENVDKNFTHNNAIEKISVTASPLLWGSDMLSTLTNNATDDCTSSMPKKFDLVIGSDLLYNTQESYDPLLTTIQHHLEECGTLILSVRWRKPDLEREFFHKAEALGLIFTNWKEFEESETFKHRCPAKMTWMDYGNPASESSNEYFNNNSVSIKRSNTTTSKSLAEITEEDLEGMNDDEYAIFEELQIQIYIGRWRKGRKRDFECIR